MIPSGKETNEVHNPTPAQGETLVNSEVENSINLEIFREETDQPVGWGVLATTGKHEKQLGKLKHEAYLVKT